GAGAAGSPGQPGDRAGELVQLLGRSAIAGADPGAELRPGRNALFRALRNDVAGLAGDPAGERRLVSGGTCSHGGVMSTDPSLLAFLVAMFLGGFVSGISGFAFSAVAGAILLQVYSPSFAVPLMMACALVAQLYGLVSLRNSMEWRRALPLIVGGCAGIPL